MNCSIDFCFFVVVIRQRQFTNYLTVNFKLRIILRSSWDLSPECSPLPGRTLLYKAEYCHDSYDHSTVPCWLFILMPQSMQNECRVEDSRSVS